MNKQKRILASGSPWFKVLGTFVVFCNRTCFSFYYTRVKSFYCQSQHIFFSLFQNKLRAWLFDLILQKKFEVFIMSVILINMVTMMMEHNNQTESFTAALNILLTNKHWPPCSRSPVSIKLLSPLVTRVFSIKQRKSRKEKLIEDNTFIIENC